MKRELFNTFISNQSKLSQVTEILIFNALKKKTQNPGLQIIYWSVYKLFIGICLSTLPLYISYKQEIALKQSFQQLLTFEKYVTNILIS